jgi:hypothetical protein
LHNDLIVRCLWPKLARTRNILIYRNQHANKLGGDYFLDGAGGVPCPELNHCKIAMKGFGGLIGRLILWM